MPFFLRKKKNELVKNSFTLFGREPKKKTNFKICSKTLSRLTKYQLVCHSNVKFKKVKKIIRLFALIYFGAKQFATNTASFCFVGVEHSSTLLLCSLNEIFKVFLNISLCSKL